MQALYDITDRQQVESSGFKSEVQRKITELNRQIFDSQKRMESLELVEQNLLEKLDKKEEENFELKSHLDELRA